MTILLHYLSDYMVHSLCSSRCIENTTVKMKIKIYCKHKHM
jgi:hypothetical protein